MAPNWDDIYRDKFNESSKGFDEQRKQYQDAQAAEQAALDKQRDTASKRAQQAQGISGGMTETTASNIFRDYLRSKSAADASYNTAMSDLQNSYMTNSSTLKSSWAQKQAELDQQQRSQAMEQAKFAYEIALKEEERRKQEEEERKRQEEAERRYTASKKSSSGTVKKKTSSTFNTVPTSYIDAKRWQAAPAGGATQSKLPSYFYDKKRWQGSPGGK